MTDLRFPDFPLRPCVSCRHYVEEWGTHPVGGGRKIEAFRCNVAVWSPVLDQFGQPECHTARLSEAMCGIGGKWWEPNYEQRADRPGKAV